MAPPREYIRTLAPARTAVLDSSTHRAPAERACLSPRRHSQCHRHDTPLLRVGPRTPRDDGAGRWNDAVVDWPLLAELPYDERHRFLANCRRQRFAKGDVVFHAGDPAESLHLVAKGRLGVWSYSEFGDATLLRLIGPSGFVGEMSLLGAGEQRSATVRALDAVETLSVRRDDFDRLRLEQPSVDRVLLAALSSELRRISDLLTEMLFVPAETRVLRRLLSVAGIWGDGEPLTITQQELAGLAGTTRATANRALRQAAGEGLIDLRRGSVQLLDAEGLSRRAHVSHSPL